MSISSAPSKYTTSISPRPAPSRMPSMSRPPGPGTREAGVGVVKDMAGARPRLDPGAVLAAIEGGRAERAHQVLERQHRLDIDQVAGDGGDALAGDAPQPLGH